MANIGYASLGIIPTAKGMGGAIEKEISGPAAKAGTTAGKAAGSNMKSGILTPLKGMGGGIAAALGGAAILGFFKGAVGEAREGQKVSAITAQTIKATGGAAKITADQVGALSTAISNKTGMDDEAIQAGANLLLTFKNVRNEVGQGANIFDRATAAAADLSAAGFGDLSGTSKQLGKALNDPVKGIAALSKSGVTFSATQQQMIKDMVASGNTLGAQKLILGEVEAQVGGVAAASATMGEKSAVAFGNFKEQIGGILLPVIDKLHKVLLTKIIPGVSGFVTGMQEGTGAGGKFVTIAKGVGTAVLAIGSALITTAKFVKDNSGAFLTLGAAIGIVSAATAAHSLVLAVNSGALSAWVAKTAIVQGATKAWAATQWILNAAMSANPIGLVVIAIAALVAGVIYAYKNSEKFRQILTKAFDAVKIAGSKLVGWFKALPGTIVTAVGNARTWLLQKGKDFITGLATGVYNTAKSLITWWVSLPGKILGFIGSVGSKLTQKGADFITGLAKGVYNAAKSLLTWWGGLQLKIVGLIGDVASSLYNKGVNFISGLARGVYATATGLFTWFGSLPGKVVTGIGDLASTLYSAGQDLLRGMIGGVKSMASNLISSVTKPVSDAIGKAKSLLGINSPSRVFMEIGRFTGLGMINGMKGTFGKLSSTAAAMMTAATPTRLPAAPAPNGGTALDRLAAAAGGNGNTITIPVHGADDPAATAREVGRQLANRGV